MRDKQKWRSSSVQGTASWPDPAETLKKSQRTITETLITGANTYSHREQSPARTQNREADNTPQQGDEGRFKHLIEERLTSSTSGCNDATARKVMLNALEGIAHDRR